MSKKEKALPKKKVKYPKIRVIFDKQIKEAIEAKPEDDLQYYYSDLEEFIKKVETDAVRGATKIFMEVLSSCSVAESKDTLFLKVKKKEFIKELKSNLKEEE